MPGTTNQLQTPMGAGVQAIIETAVNTESGLGLIPTDPTVTTSGVVSPGNGFTVWEAVSLAAGNYTPVLLANWIGTSNTFQQFMTTIDFGAITQVNNAFSTSSNAITSLTANSLIQFSSDFTPGGGSLTTVSLPNLKYIGGSLGGSTAVTPTFSLPELIAINSGCSIACNSATTFSIPKLEYVGVAFQPSATTATTIDLSSLEYVGGAISPTFTAATTLAFPALLRVIGNLAVSSTSMVNFSLNSGLLQVGGNFTLTGAALSQASVDGILVSLAALDGTGGTTSYNSKTVNVSGGTSSAPSATGLTAKATLQGRGCTVTTN